MTTCLERMEILVFRLLSLALILSTAGGFALAVAAEKTLLVDGLENPESVVEGDDGRVYVTEIGKSDVNGDGRVIVIEDGKPKTFAKGLDDPKGIARKGKEFIVADKDKIRRIDSTGNASVLADASDFPVKPRFFNDIECGPEGDIFISDSGTFVTNGVVFRIKPTREISIVVDTKTLPGLKAPNGLLMDGERPSVPGGFRGWPTLSDRNCRRDPTRNWPMGLGGTDGIGRDAKGRIYVSDWRGGPVLLT